jgi:hypothetical protein
MGNTRSAGGRDAGKQIIDSGDVEDLRKFIKENDPSIDDNYLLKYSCYLGKAELVRVLLFEDNRTNPAAGDNYCLKCACEKGFLEIVRMLLHNFKDVIDPSVDDNYCIKIASKKGFVEIMNILAANEKVALKQAMIEAGRGSTRL